MLKTEEMFKGGDATLKTIVNYLHKTDSLKNYEIKDIEKELVKLMNIEKDVRN